MPALRELVLGFIADLRAAGVRISIAESLDAMNAVPLAGLERTRLREALRSSLIKDIADDAIFEAEFARSFGFGSRLSEPRSNRAAYSGVSGQGNTPGMIDSLPFRPAASSEKRRSTSSLPENCDAQESDREKFNKSEHAKQDRNHSAPCADERKSATGETGAESQSGKDAEIGQLQGAERAGSSDASGLAETARLNVIAALPFIAYTDLHYEQARDVLALLTRRLRVRLGRRMRLASKGRIDFRRTIRAAIPHGGAMVELRFRVRRPRHIDLLVLADISGSVKYATNLMLEILAGARQCFHRVTSLVYIDRLAEAGFEQGHLVTTPMIDRYARSDFGRVLSELLEDYRSTIGPATVVVIMGDGRNNRRPPRVDLMRDLRRRTRAVVWLNPEPPERWGTGDSAIRQYEKEVDILIPCGQLHQLEAALGTLI